MNRKVFITIKFDLLLCNELHIKTAMSTTHFSFMLRYKNGPVFYLSSSNAHACITEKSKFSVDQDLHPQNRKLLLFDI